MTENENTETNAEQVDRITHALLDAIPDDVCYFNVLVALAHLIEEVSVVLHEENHEMTGGGDDDDDNTSPIGRLPGSSFSNN